MGSAIRWCRIRATTVALLALTVAALAAPRVARAGCSHPPGVEPAHAAATAHFDHLARAGALPHNEPPAPPPRCSGPSCSQAPTPAAPAPEPAPGRGSSTPPAAAPS